MNLQLLLLAAEGHAPPPLVDIDGTVFVQAGIFFLLMWVLSKLVFKPYLALREEQEAHTTGAVAAAEQEQAEADERLRRYEARIMEVKKAAASGRAEQRALGQAEGQRVLGEARTEAESKVAAARARIASSAPAARLSLRTRADDLARVVAAKVLGRSLQP